MRSRSSLAALALLLGCGEADSTLSGSIGRTHPLGFERAEVRRVGPSYTVAYLRGAETVARLAYTPSGAVAVGQSVALDFGARGNAGLSRATSDGLPFPDAKSGTLTLQTDPAAAAAGDTVR